MAAYFTISRSFTRDSAFKNDIVSSRQLAAGRYKCKSYVVDEVSLS